MARGDALLSPAITRRLIGEYVARRDREPAPEGLDVLTDREREVTALVARGLSNDEIAAHMVISPATAKTHVSRAMTKLRRHGTAPSSWCSPTNPASSPRGAADRVPPGDVYPSTCTADSVRWPPHCGIFPISPAAPVEAPPSR